MKDGYYWVKICGEWNIEYFNGDWFIIDSRVYHKTELEEIGDYIETPEKYRS